MDVSVCFFFFLSNNLWWWLWKWESLYTRQNSAVGFCFGMMLNLGCFSSSAVGGEFFFSYPIFYLFSHFSCFPLQGTCDPSSLG